jgi:hypothetical protein
MGLHQPCGRVVGSVLTALAMTIGVTGVLVTNIPASASGVAYATGDVFAGVGTGLIKHFNSSGTLLDTLDTGTGCGEDLGMAFDASGNLYGTAAFGACTSGTVSKFDKMGNLIGPFGSGYSFSTESITIDGSGNVYVGQPDGTGQVLEFNSAGTPINSFSPAPEGRGTDWIDLASDQCTLFYTSEGLAVKRFNTCTNTQLTDFATGLPGPCFAMRIRPNGEVMVACESAVVRLSSSGTIIQTYAIPAGASFLFALNLDGDNTSFWTADYFNGDIFRFDIASGSQLATFNGGRVGCCLSGLAVFGEIRVAEQPTLSVSAATGDFADPTTVSAVLSLGGSPISGEPVKFTLNGSETCTGTTNGTGTASCAITPAEAPGTYTLAASFAGDTTKSPPLLAAAGSANFVVTQEQTSLSYSGATSAVNGQPATLSGVLTTDDPSASTPLAGKTVTFTLGTGGTAQTCSTTTDSTGLASCTIASVNQTVGSVPVAASFAGDTYYLPASASSSVTVFAPTALGAFVVGNVSAGNPTVGNAVNFWGAQWATTNVLSGGSAPSAMKGFADDPSALTCGSTWTTRTGNSSAPPATLPGQIDVIVSSKVTRSGSTISGTVLHIVVVQVNPGYGPAPGHVGTGTIIATVC